MASRGLRNDNPGNIRIGDKWQGLARRDEMTNVQKREKEFCVFTSPEWGIRAMVKIIQTYERKYSINTVRGIISRWAPPGDNNDTESYIKAVAKSVGPADLPLNLSNTRTMMALVKAIIRHENGEQPYDDATIRAAIALTRVKASKPKPWTQSKRLRGGALVGGAVTTMTSWQRLLDGAGDAVQALMPDLDVTDGTRLAVVLGALLLAFGLYVGWTVWIDYRDRGEPEEATR